MYNSCQHFVMRLKHGLARNLRKEMTPPEVRLWVRLRSRAKGNLIFRRQHPVGPYVLDFYCPKARLAVEVDGFAHTKEENILCDMVRDQWLGDKGIHTYRIPAHEIMKDADSVAAGVYDLALSRLKSP